MRFIIKALFLFALLSFSSLASAVNYQVGLSGLTQATDQITCDGANPTIEVVLINPKRTSKASVYLNGAYQTTLTATVPSAIVQLTDGNNSVDVTLNRKTTDNYQFVVSPGLCSSGNTSDGTYEYGVNGTSKIDVGALCMWNGATYQPAVRVYRVNTGTVNITLNGLAFWQLSGSNTAISKITPLRAGTNTITTTYNTYVTDPPPPVDTYIRDGGDGTCVPTP